MYHREPGSMPSIFWVISSSDVESEKGQEEA